MSGDNGPILLIGQGEQYWDEEDWRELVRSKRLRRGMDVAVREHGQTAFQRVEDVPGLRAILDQLDPLPTAGRTAAAIPSAVEPTQPSREAALPAGAAATGEAGGAAALGTASGNARLRYRSSRAVVPAGRESDPDTAELPSPSALSPPSSYSAKARLGPAAVISLCVLGVVVAGALATSLTGGGAPPTSPSESNGLQVASDANTPADAAPPANPTDAIAPDAPAVPASETTSASSDGANTLSSEVPSTSPEMRPSFDCTTATEWTARQVCGDAGLAALDRRMAELYARRMAASSTDGATELRDEQRAWIARRKSCQITSDPACLRDAYNARLAELSAPSQSASENPAAPAPESSNAGGDDSARSAAAAARVCIQRGDLDCAELNLTTLLQLQPGRADARRLLDQVRAQRQRSTSDNSDLR